MPLGSLCFFCEVRVPTLAVAFYLGSAFVDEHEDTNQQGGGTFVLRSPDLFLVVSPELVCVLVIGGTKVLLSYFSRTLPVSPFPCFFLASAFGSTLRY